MYMVVINCSQTDQQVIRLRDLNPLPLSGRFGEGASILGEIEVART